MENEINILDYWHVITKRKKLIALFVGSVTLLAIIYALLIPKTYKAEAALLPVGGERNMGMAALIAQSGLGSLLGDVTQNNSATPIMAILKSRSMAETIIEEFSLRPILFEGAWDKKNQTWKSSDPKNVPNMDEAIDALNQVVSVDEDKKTTLIGISAEFHDPKLAADVVNGYVEELGQFLRHNELTSAKRNRVFIEDQLSLNKALLLQTGKELSQFYQNNQISNRDPLVDVDISLHRQLSETITPEAKQDLEQFNENRTMLANKLKNISPAVRDEIVSLEAEKAKLEKKLQESRLVKDVPQQVYLEYLSGYYRLLAQMNALLTQEVEMAKIEEAKHDITFQIIDAARPPLRKFKPKRALIVMGAFATALFFVICLVFFLEYIARLKEVRHAAAEKPKLLNAVHQRQESR